MNRVLFETDYMSLSGVKFIIFSIFTVLFFYLCFKGLTKIDRRLRIKGKRIGVLRILEKAVLFFIVIYIAAVIDEYIHTVVYYKAGYYFEIEGVVENYSSGPGRNGTTFTVDGVEFHCPDNSWGYYPTNENSKVIKENGQYLKIRYIPHDIQGNVIVYIEQMIPEDEEVIAAGGGYMLAIGYLVILIFLLLYGYLIHRVSPTKIKITAVVVYVISMIFIGIVYDILNMFLLATIAVIFYTGVMVAIGFRKEKKIYHGIAMIILENI